MSWLPDSSMFVSASRYVLSWLADSSMFVSASRCVLCCYLTVVCLSVQAGMSFVVT